MRRPLLALLLLGTFDLAAAVTGYVIDDDGKPLPGVRVRAVAPESQEAQFARLASATPDPAVLGEAKTNDAGAFIVDTKRTPVVTLLLDAPGRVWTSEEVVDGEDAGAFQLRAAAMKKGRITAGGKPVANARVILNNAFVVHTNDAGEYTAPDPEGWLFRISVLHPDYALAEQVRLREWPPLDVVLERGIAARGRVVDPAGQPVANATVLKDQWPVARSAEDGTFTISHLDGAVTLLHVRDGNRIGSAKPNAEVVVRPGATVAGTLRSSRDDAPVAGARVMLRGEGMSPFHATAITDAKGSFVIDGAPADVVVLSATHPAFSVTAAGDVRTAEGRRTDRALAATPLSRLAGIVVDEQKKPVSGARVTFLGAGPTAFTAPDGTFSRRVHVRERGTTLDVMKASYAGATYGPVQAEPGEARGGLRIVLQRGTRFEFRLVDRQGVAVAGEPLVILRRGEAGERAIAMPVRCGMTAETASCRSDAEGKVAVNVAAGAYDIRAGGVTTVEKRLVAQTLSAGESPLTVELERGAVVEGRVVWSDGTAVTVPATVSTGEGRGGTAQVVDGAFTLRNVAPGKVVLTPQSGPPSFLRGEPVEVDAPASGVVLKLMRPGRIEGRVTERDTQRAVRQFSVSGETRGGMRRGANAKAFTADDGRFVLEDVAPGSLDVIVTAPGYVASTTGAVEVAEGKATTVEVTLERAGTLTGRVTSGGRPVPGANIMSRDGRATRGPAAKQTDANGEYVLDTLPAGSHDLTVAKSGYVSKTLTVHIAVGKETRGDVELSRGRELQGRVVDSSGRGVAGADVSVRPVGRSAMSFSAEGRVSDADGNFRIEGLADVPVTVVARKAGFAEGVVEVNPAAAMNVTVTLERGGTLSGRVTGLPPDELQSVEVSAMSFGSSRGATARTTPDGSGNFTISGVSDGDVTVTAQQVRPPRRRVTSSPLKVIAGSGPFVELDFSAGIAVRGRVTRGGQVPGRGSLHFIPADPRESNRGTSGEFAPNGTYEVRVPAAGEYRVLVSFWEAGAGAAQAGKVDVRGDMQHDIDIRGATVRVRVVDGASGGPLPDTRLALTGTEGRGATDRTTDSAGRAVFDFVADGTYTVRAMRPGYVVADPRELVVQHGAGADVEIALTRGEEVVVRLVDAATGAPVDGYTVILDASGKTVADRPATIDPGGAHRFWLRPGNYSVRAAGRDYAPSVAPLVVPGTPFVQIDLKKLRRE